MKRYFFTTLHSILLFTLVFSSVLLPINHKSEPQVAHALLGGATGGPVTVIGGNGTIQESLSAAANSITASAQSTLLIKELTLDGIAHGLAKMVLKSMTQSILNWINSGFQGSPAFVSDLESFLINRADEIAGDFIYNDPNLNFLCSPFQLDVKVALATSYQQTTRGGASSAQCTLSEVSDNIENFLGGDFQNGGWPAWFEVTQKPQNTPIGAYLLAEEEMYARIANDQGQTIRELDWGNGFLSFKVCDSSSGSGSPNEQCDITTPGAVIANQINSSLGAGQDALIEADEINEIISALFAQLAQQAITGLNGLLGLGGSSQFSDTSYGADGTQSFLDAMLEEDVDTTQLLGEDPVTSAIAVERSYIELQQQIIDDVTDVETELEELIELHTPPEDSDEAPSCNVNVTLPSTLDRAREQARADIRTSEDTVATLLEIEAEYEAATDAEERSVAMEPFLDLVAQQKIKSEIDITKEEIDIEKDIDPRIADFRNTLRTICESEGR